MPIRDVQGVPIVAWPEPGALRTAPADVRALLDQRAGVDRVLLDLSRCPDLNPDGIEALTEAYRVLSDRNAKVGMFGLSFATTQLLGILGLEEDLPPHLGGSEEQALAALNNGGVAVPGAGAPPGSDAEEFTIDVPPAAGGVELTFDLDTPPPGKGQAPVEIEFDLGDVGSAPTARFDPSAVAAATGMGTGSDAGLTAVLWADLAAQGYVIGGDGADEIMAAVATPGGGSAAPRAASAPAADDAGTIDLDDVLPATRSADDDSSEESLGWTAAPAASSAGIDFSAVPINPALFGAPPPDPAAGAFSGAGGAFGGAGGAFGGGANPFTGSGPAAFGGSAMVSSSLFGGPAGDFSPVDSGAGPPPAALQARAAGPPPALTPLPPPVPDRAPADSDETVMFDAGALDQALAAAAAAAAASVAQEPDPTPADPPAPVVSATPTPIAVASEADLTDDETVMIQPGMLDAALLAEVAKAAGAESPPPAPEVAKPTPAPAPAPAPSAVPTGDEVSVRLFLLDHGIKSDLQVEVLRRLLEQERVIGPGDLGLPGDVRAALDGLAQTRLVRRQRSARVRGGSGYLLAASPQARGTVTRLVRMWGDPQGRAKLTVWLNEA